MSKTAEAPAYRVALVADQLALLGEIVVILGQIDDDMTRSLTGILQIDRATANRLMWSQEPIDLWAGVLKGRVDHPHYDHAVTLAAAEVKSVMRDRNDFIHADYRNGFMLDGRFITARGSTNSEPLTAPMQAVASRSRDQKRRNVSELATLRDRVARASRLVAHIVYAVAPHGSWDGSQWLASVEPFLARSANRPVRKDLPSPDFIQTFDDV